MSAQLHHVLIENGFELCRETELCNAYANSDDSVTVSVFAGRILISGDSEHTIDTHLLDEYDIVFLMHILKVIDLARCVPLKPVKQMEVPKKKCGSGWAGPLSRALSGSGNDWDQKQQLQLNVLQGV